MNPQKQTIAHSAKIISIDIDGVIGVDEQEQFGVADSRVSTYGRFREALEEIELDGADKLVLNIRSTGGQLEDALLIYEAVRALDIEVITRCYGYVASAATIIAQAASKGHREISANSLYLIHCCESTIEGNAHQLSATKELLDKSDQRLAEIYALSSGGNPEEFRQLMNQNGGRGKWLSPEECVEVGLADTIIASSAISNDASEQLASLGLPPLPQPKQPLRKRIIENCASILSKVGLGKMVVEGGRKESATLAVSAAESAVVDVVKSTPSRLMTARATTLKQQVDDPLPTDSSQSTGNQAAYEGDIEGLKEAFRSTIVRNAPVG